MIAVEYRQYASQRPQVWIGRVERVFSQNAQIEAVLYHIPPNDRYGPWDRRKWAVLDTPEGPKREVFSTSEILTVVQLDSDGSLDAVTLWHRVDVSQE